MGESGKRNRGQRDNDGDSRNQKRRLNDRDDKSNNELVVYRILCPDEVIGSVIGKGGKVINSIRQETRAKVKVVDPYPGSKYRVITIYCFVKEKEEIEVEDEFYNKGPLCASQDALLRVHTVVANAIAVMGDSEKKRADKYREECQILVPSSQSSNIIGKAGSTIKKLRGKTRANIKVTAKDAGDPSHSCAMDFDNFVQITGEPEAVKKALFAVSAIMYKFSPREEIPLETTVAEAPPAQSIIIPSDVPIYPPGFSGASRSEELIVRVLCPFDKIGRVIGRAGSTIKSIRQASGARIDVDDTKADRDDCIITVIATESPDDLKSMAVEAVLLLQGKINDEDHETVTMRLLVPSKVIGCIIGKGGSIINEIRKRTKADVRISKKDKPKCADANDELVEVAGEVSSVRDALIQIVLRLRDDVLKEKDGGHNPSVGADALYSGGASLSVSSLLSSVPPVATLAFDQRAESGSDLGVLSSSSLYGYGTLPVRNYGDMGENGYGSMPSYSSKLYGGLPASSTLEILIPSNAVGKVMGKGGLNLANIRKLSGAMIEISESKSSRGERVALITGTPQQKREAENLIQAFIMAT
ncbi:KH domain-containing protein At4g18375 isoform X3 [Gossypium hirsutum]|uniref:KH domain-containing protein At4g18375 isoform X3 n=1 Tax=Gossypium hirsutum TaxID=3635 RepID=A0A1U8HS21_GOSHI|nr:KH domain-containing protein At4g18375 isoform X3 [Gossypium hirsutum]